jgi:hypothetical protein
MATNGGLDTELVKLVEDRFDHINDVRHNAQEAALEAYEGFFALGASPERWIPPQAN